MILILIFRKKRRKKIKNLKMMKIKIQKEISHLKKNLFQHKQ